MFGHNPKRPPEKGDGSTLLVQEIFPTLQGEGPFVGHPAVFLRLGGCNLACSFCDTEFESFTSMTLDKVLEAIAAVTGKIDLVVITGGEPLRQEIGPLCAALLAKGMRVQIETNGTIWRPLPEGVHVICSPKVTDGRYHALRSDMLARVDALKFIIAEDSAEYHDVADVGQGARAIPVYVQPMDQGDPMRNRANMTRAAMLAQANGYRLSLQTHKILGIP